MPSKERALYRSLRNKLLNKELGDDLLSHAKSTLSLALTRFTALFEMGRGGSKSLLSPSITGMS